MNKQKKRLIYVEDNDSISMLVKYKLSKEGFEVEALSDGEHAFEIIQDRLPDIVILDLMLPIKDGLTILKEIKGNPVTSHIPVIMLTTHAEEDIILKCFEAGASDYITKPFSTPVLLARINKIFN